MAQRQLRSGRKTNIMVHNAILLHKTKWIRVLVTALRYLDLILICPKNMYEK